MTLFGQNDEVDEAEIQENGVPTGTSEDIDVENKRLSIPFFSRFLGGKSTNRQVEATASKNDQSAVSKADTVGSGGAVATLEKESATSDIKKVERAEETPESLRAKAERARLEAERMDAELTLMKIDRLAKQLSKAQTKGEAIDDLQRQLDDLQAKLRGEPPKPRPVPSKAVTQPVAMTAAGTTTPSTDQAKKNSIASTSSSTRTSNDDDIVQTARKQILDGEDDVTIEFLRFVPGFMLKIMALTVEMDTGDAPLTDADKEELVKRMNMIRAGDYSFSKRPKPEFTNEQIDDAVETYRRTKGVGMFNNPEAAKMRAGGNETQIALDYLTFEYYSLGNVEEAIENNDINRFLPVFLQSALNDTGIEVSWNLTSTSTDFIYERLYPQCTRKEGEEPTEAQVDALMRTVLPAVKFSSSSKPEKVKGGYLIRGTHKFDKGDDLIDAIESELAKNGALAGKMTVLYTPDTTPAQFSLMDDDSTLDFDEIMEAAMEEEKRDPILYITGPDITRDSNRFGLTVASILGIATSWYLSIYPFLLNDEIARRVDGQLSLVEIGQQPDLTWLTDLSVPLFTTFLALQAVHELAHRIVAATKGVELSFPVFVPSLITGVTSTVTTFKSLPKNREDMFDISASGPLFGVIASAITIAIGTKLTLVSDPSMLPSLPLDILRQSTLGGGIIENIMPGSLYVPEGAPTNGIMISLHPVAIAGYISLIVNALSLLPIGSELEKIVERWIGKP
jgi:hypothetical protein